MFLTTYESLQKKIEELELIAKAGNINILISGETGTGKELIAQRIGEVTKKKVISVNCAGIVPTLFESELYGHEKGSFTGALFLHKGLLELAHKNILFLDEIGDLDFVSQAKLLRVIETKKFRRVGGEVDRDCDCMFISASNKDFNYLLDMNKFRMDLKYRLFMYEFYIPPLKERPRDIELLVNFYLNKFQIEYNKKGQFIKKQTFDNLILSPFPGNVRELIGALRISVILTPDNSEIVINKKPAVLDYTKIKEIGALEMLEKEAVLNALSAAEWVQRDAAKILKISPRKLNYRIKHYKITHPSWRKNKKAPD